MIDPTRAGVMRSGKRSTRFSSLIARAGAMMASTTIKQRLLLLVAAIALPLNAVILVVILQLTEAAREAQRDGLRYSARAVTAALDSQLDTMASVIEGLSRSPSLLEPSLAAFEVEARRHFGSFDGAWVIVADLEGRQLLNTGRPASASGPPAAQPRARTEGAVALSDIGPDPATGTWIATLEIPVAKNGRPFRVLSVGMSAAVFQRLLEVQPMPESWLSGIIDSKGRFVARVPRGSSLVGQPASEGWRATRHIEGWSEFKSREGDPVVNYNARPKFGGWAVAIGVKKEALEAYAADTTRWSMLLGSFLSLLSLALAVLLGRSIAAPIAALRSDIVRFSGPVRAARAGPPEIVALGEAMKAASAERLRNETRLTMLLRVTSQMGEAHERDELARIVFENVGAALDADLCLKYRFDDGDQRLHLVYSSGLPNAELETVRVLELGQAYCGTVAERNQPLTADATRIADDPRAALLRRIGVTAYCCHVVRARDGRVLGTLALASRRRRGFTSDDVALLSSIVNVLAQAVERTIAEGKLRQAHDTFRHLVDESPFGIYTVDADFRLAAVSSGARKVFETVDPLIGRDFAEVLGKLWQEPFASSAIARFRHTLRTGEPFHSRSTVEQRRDIGEVEAYDWRLERIVMPDGRPGVVCHFYDLSERLRHESALRAANDRQSVLMRELAHRGRNLLAVIQSIARRSWTGERPAEVERTAFFGRLQAIADTFAGFTETAAETSPLLTIVEGALKTFVDRAEIGGPAVLVTARAAQTFGLIVHELATNSAKYGALSVPEGTIDVGWQVAEDGDAPRFEFHWREEHVRGVTVPTRTGFGTSLLMQVVGHEFQCRPEIEYRSEGLCYRFSAALAGIGTLVHKPAAVAASSISPIEHGAGL